MLHVSYFDFHDLKSIFIENVFVSARYTGLILYVYIVVGCFVTRRFVRNIDKYLYRHIKNTFELDLTQSYFFHVVSINKLLKSL